MTPLAVYSHLHRLTLIWGIASFLTVTRLGAGEHFDQPNFDRRARTPQTDLRSTADHRKGLEHLAELAPEARVDFDPVVGNPRWISAPGSFLSGLNGVGKAISDGGHRGVDAADPHKAMKAFLNEHALLFGHDSSGLHHARITLEFRSPHSGLLTTVWEQEIDGVPVFDAVLVGHATAAGELVNISSQFVPDAVHAKKNPEHPRLATLSARRAILLAALHLGEDLIEGDIRPVPGRKGRTGSEHFSAKQLKGDIDARLVWLPMDRSTLRLSWDIILTRGKDRLMFRILVDALSGEVLIRRCLSSDISNASYRVFTSDSPSPFSPGWPVPSTAQPPIVPQSLVVISALNTNASPNGWINDGDNETRGNNVDAHLDRNADNLPDLPRPHGSPNRVFDFPLNLAQPPGTYGDAAVVHVFYWCNWYHDKLYELGFTETAGNFQMTNFGRGGAEGDPVMADVQNGGAGNNDFFSTPPDGISPRMELYLFDGPSPDRDGALDTEVILHEHTHGLSTRRVGGGVGLTLRQAAGLGEGWSDFYALALLSEPGDDPGGNYPIGGYSAYLYNGPFGPMMDNYYFGMRRYPYSTDMTKSPLTLLDIDPSIVGNRHSGIPRSSVVGSVPADEVHALGEVWCVTLWEARANLINKYGFGVGNRLILQLVTDGMNLSPPNPTFLEARDAIIQADFVDNGGANFHELWAAFAKRGMGANATVPDGTTTRGVQEDYSMPDELVITPGATFVSTGEPDGPFGPISQTYTLTNLGPDTISWSVSKNSTWLSISTDSGTLPAGGPAATVIATLNNKANLLPIGVYTTTLVFTNQFSRRIQSRQFVLRVGQPDYLTQWFQSNDNDVGFNSWTFIPDGSRSFYSVCREPAAVFPVDPRDGKALAMLDDNSQQITLSGGSRVSFYGRSTNVFFIGSNGYLTFDTTNAVYVPSFSSHFSLPRIAALFQDLNPQRKGRVSWQQLGDRVAVSFENVPEFNDIEQLEDDPANSNNFQFELFYDGRIRLTFLGVSAHGGLVGLSQGIGIPPGFAPSDFSSYPSCASRLTVLLPSSATEGNGILALQGQVWLPAPTASNVVVLLKSSDLSEVTVPASIIVPAGHTNAFFDIGVVDDVVVDGTQVVSVSATAPEHLPGSANISIHDNEIATLDLTAPNSIFESGGDASVTLTVNAPVASDVVVALNSSVGGRLGLPSAVVIPAGSTSVTFPLTALNNNRIEGTALVTLTAHVQNWVDAVRVIQVLDDDLPILSLHLPTAAAEAGGIISGGGFVSLPGVLSSNLVISVISSNQSRVTVPQSVVLPAGQSNIFFSFTVIDNGIADGDQNVALMVQASGFASASATIRILDDETPSIPTYPTPAHLSVGNTWELDLRWHSAPGEQGTIYSVYLGTVSNLGPAQLIGSTSNTFWHLAGLLGQTTYFWRVIANHVGQTAGPIWQFTTEGIDHFELSQPGAIQTVDQPFNLTVTARNSANQTVSNFVGSADIDALFGPAPIRLFSEGFEDAKLSGWSAFDLWRSRSSRRSGARIPGFETHDNYFRRTCDHEGR